jgi:YidC/Oxa1 family membrane protein insertase
MDILYTILIAPLETVIELAYLVFWRIFHSPSIAVPAVPIALVGVSAAVSVLTLPLYFMAERYQAAERTIQKAMLPEIQNIKAVFKGDEQYLMLAAWYRQNNYHPMYALRSSLGVAIQIPFFIAAYHFVANLEQLQNISFLFIDDLSLPDAAFQVGNITLNILPVIMTVINAVSGAVYTKGFPARDKVQLYGMAAVFLVLLYNSPSALVLYWTCNNLFSLIKNVLQKTKHPGNIIYAASCAVAAVTFFYVLFVHRGALHKRILLAAILATVFFVPLFAKYAAIIKQKLKFPRNCAVPCVVPCAATDTKTFVLSAAALFLLAGLVTPSTVIASSVGEFSFLAPYTSPLPFIARTLTQSAGIFLFWPLCLYALFSRKVKTALTVCLTVFCYLAAVNTFLFQDYYGFLTPDLHFSAAVQSSVLFTLINSAAMLLCASIIVFLLYTPKKYLLAVLQNITLIAFLVLGGVHVHSIMQEFSARETSETQQIAAQADSPSSLEKVYTFSKTGQNVLVIMLDRAMSGFVPYIFAEKPALLPFFSGFVYYPNTVSFGGHTLMGAPGLFGGYEYAPLEIQKNDAMPLAEKYDEALAVLPKLFADNGFQVSVSNLPVMNPGLYDHEPGITSANTTGNYTDHYLALHPELNLKYYSPVLESSFIRFSFFKFSPLIIRNFVYDNGDYLLPNPVHLISTTTMDNYAVLAALPEITAIASDNQNRFIMLNNELTHDAAFLEAPSYEPVTELTDKGSGPFANVESYHANMAAFLLLGKWFAFLKENGVYDNTRIIIVSDHGFDVATRLKDRVKLPNRDMLEIYQALLLVKDFNAQTAARIAGELPSDNTFMTNADVPVLATKGLLAAPVNPFTGKTIRSEKETGVTITTSHLWQVRRQLKNTYNIKPNEWLHVRDDIFKPENWSRVRQ